MSLNDRLKDFYLGFKNQQIDEKEIISNYKKIIFSFDDEILKDDYAEQIEENILLIYGYTFRLNDNNQRLFYTFSEAVNAINMENLMRNEDGVKLNAYVYTRVLKLILDEIINNNIDKEFKLKAINAHKSLEDAKAKENKYHVYQY